MVFVGYQNTVNKH